MCSLSVYETAAHFYIIGSDPKGKRFRTLKIDRVTDKEFIAAEPDQDYTQADIGELLATVSSSSIVTPTEKWNKRRSCAGGGGLLRTVEKAWGIIGAVRFMEGFYLLIVSRAKMVVSIGVHSIYKIEDVSMIYIPATGAATHPDEAKYSKLFLSVDFTADFYFSYTYQLSRTLQENCLAEFVHKWNGINYGKTIGPEKKFVWNEYLMEPLDRAGINRKWTLELMRGFVAHQLLELPCAKLDLILIARRSSAFAGTRFLKRGVNCEGAVANDVETEQVVWDTSSPLSFRSGKFSSFIQRRGSVPLFWSQDPTHRGSPMVVGKPPILIDRVEPHALTTAKHFRELGRKYGHPLVVLNLVKREEHRHNENLLHKIFLKTVRYLNDFRRVGECIDYISFDVSRCNKSGRVLQRLEEIGQRVAMSGGWFQNFPLLHSRLPHNLLDQMSSAAPPKIEENISHFTAQTSPDGRMLLQHGVVRSNCVDCLDRTNVVQFGIGKVALGWQLYSMGFLALPWSLQLHSEVCRVFEEMFDEHGNTLAWQYAGSQLVHSIKTYKRTAVFQERSRDVFQTISRYYSNTFGDFEKQDGLNLFLGIFRVPSNPSDPSQAHIWSFGSDHYLHFPMTRPKKGEFLEWSVSVNSDTNENEFEGENDWFRDRELLPQEENIGEKQNGQFCSGDVAFDLAYRTFEMTSLEQLIRSLHKSQIRRPLILDALEQGPQYKDSFMRMFRASDHSPSPPPSAALRRQSSVASSTFSSLAAGRASIVRESIDKTEAKVVEESNDGRTEEEEAEDEAETDALTVAATDLPAEEQFAEFTVLTTDERRANVAMATREAAEVALAVVAVDDLDGSYADFLVMEDKNGAAERSKNPLMRFESLLNENPEKKVSTDPSVPSLRFGVSCGLKSPNEVYFANADSSASLFPISKVDLALYVRYASATTSVFEGHNLRRQRRPTVWKLPAPFSRLRKSNTTDNSPLRQSKEEKQTKLKSVPSMQRILPAIGRMAPQSPFRKDFSKLGPMFQYRPSLFSSDSSYEIELGELSEESTRIYKEAAEMRRITAEKEEDEAFAEAAAETAGN
ncbi:hypothetical protein niasHS_010692 [Heterodera schachtii]|uniref:SAC domain-containing protein n=1 Tax=Heterodera schachtii TaxID=97005 RepID=A0ABD2IZY5_HETSC